MSTHVWPSCILAARGLQKPHAKAGPDSHSPPPPFTQIPEEMNRCRNSYVEQALLPGRLEDLTGEDAVQGGYRAYLKDSLDALLKDAKDKFKGYDSCSTPEHAELSCKKVRPLVCSSTLSGSFFREENIVLFWSIFVFEGDDWIIPWERNGSSVNLPLACQEAAIHEAHSYLCFPSSPFLFVSDRWFFPFPKH